MYPQLYLRKWTRDRDETNAIVLHSRLTPSDPKAMDQWFRRKGYLQCGFHYCVSRSGVTETRHPATVGAHLGSLDKTSVAICILGWDGKHPDTLDPLTKDHLRSLSRQLKITYPHAEFTAAPEHFSSQGGYEPLFQLTEELANEPLRPLE